MLSLHNTYSFTTLAPTVLGSDYKDMRVKSLMSVGEAIKYKDVVTLHSNLKNTVNLPDIGVCTFILFKNINNEEVVLAYEWLDPNSINKTVTTNIKVELFNTSNDNIAVINMRLKELGFTNFNVTTF
jgi:hypothetical protein